jgi:hypothetical protein
MNKLLIVSVVMALIALIAFIAGALSPKESFVDTSSMTPKQIIDSSEVGLQEKYMIRSAAKAYSDKATALGREPVLTDVPSGNFFLMVGVNMANKDPSKKDQVIRELKELAALPEMEMPTPKQLMEDPTSTQEQKNMSILDSKAFKAVYTEIGRVPTFDDLVSTNASEEIVTRNSRTARVIGMIGMYPASMKDRVVREILEIADLPVASTETSAPPPPPSLTEPDVPPPPPPVQSAPPESLPADGILVGGPTFGGYGDPSHKNTISNFGEEVPKLIGPNGGGSGSGSDSDDSKTGAAKDKSKLTDKMLGTSANSSLLINARPPADKDGLYIDPFMLNTKFSAGSGSLKTDVVGYLPSYSVFM